MSGRDDHMHADDVANVEEAVSKLRSSHEWLVRELEKTKKRHEELVAYNNECFSLHAKFTGDIHAALGHSDDADFLSDAAYLADVKRLVEERRMYLRRLVAAEARIGRIKGAANFIRPLLACDGLEADHAECSLCVVRNAVFGDEPIALDAAEEQAKALTAAMSLLRRIADECRSTDGGALQTFAPSNATLEETVAFVNASDVRAALELVARYESERARQ